MLFFLLLFCLGHNLLGVYVYVAFLVCFQQAFFLKRLARLIIVVWLGYAGHALDVCGAGGEAPVAFTTEQGQDDFGLIAVAYLVYSGE